MSSRTLSALGLTALLVASLVAASGAAPGAIGATDATATGSGDGDWQQYRGGADRDGAVTDTGPADPYVDKNWTHQGGEPEIEPVTANGTVYLGYTTGYDLNVRDGVVKAVDESTGSVEWKRDDLGSVHGVATADGLVFVQTEYLNGTETEYDTDRRLLALDAATGETVWLHNQTGSMDPLVVANGAVYLGGTAYDASTGEVRWQNFNVSVEAVHNGTLYGVNALNHTADNRTDELVARDAADRAVQWRWNPGTGIHGFAVDDGSVYVTAGNNETYALNAHDGTVRWRRTVDAPFQNSTSDRISAPAVADGRVYVTTDDEMESEGTDERVGAVHALDAADGSVAWRFQTLATLQSAPAVANGSVYVGGRYVSEGRYENLRETDPDYDSPAEVGGYAVQAVAYGLNASTGAERWNYSVEEEEGHGEELDYMNAAVDDGLVFLSYGNERTPPYDYDPDTVTAIGESETAPTASERLADDDPTALPDNEAPTVTLDVDPANATEGTLPPNTTVTITANASDPDGEVVETTWEVNGTEVEADESIAIETSACVDYEVRVTVTDDDGDTASETVVIPDSD